MASTRFGISAGVAHELMNPVSYMAQNIGLLRGELKTVSEYLQPLLRERPSSADATWYAFVATILRTPTDVPLRAEARGHENLVRFCERVEERFFHGGVC